MTARRAAPPYTPPARYTHRELISALIRDAITDVRYFQREGEPTEKALDVVRDWFRRRHVLRLDRYGWPLPAEYDRPTL